LLDLVWNGRFAPNEGRPPPNDGRLAPPEYGRDEPPNEGRDEPPLYAGRVELPASLKRDEPPYEGLEEPNGLLPNAGRAELDELVELKGRFDRSHGLEPVARAGRAEDAPPSYGREGRLDPPEYGRDEPPKEGRSD